MMTMLDSSGVDLVDVLRISYISVAAVILAVKLLPSLSNRFLLYGSRASPTQSSTSKSLDEKTSAGTKTDPKAAQGGLLDVMANVKVPHSWFASFYAVSVAASLFWAPQIILKVGLFPIVSNATIQDGSSMTLRQVIVASAMMLVQGCRRLYECLYISKPSSAEMWIGHWIFGIWFYLSMSIAIWIEGIATLVNHEFALQHFHFVPPSLRTFIATVLFIFASGVQHDCHVYLASLKKYTLPDHPAFMPVVCPHYFAECLIYLSLAIVAAPQGQIVNQTIFCALFLVAVNLGVTADGTYEWYAKRFGAESVAERRKMIPFLY